MSKTTKTILGLVILIIIVLVIYLGINKKTTLTTKEPIKIGAVLSLTGIAKNHGQNIREGIDLAVKEINERGGINGKKIKVIYEDDGTDPQKTVTIVHKFIEIDNVDVIIGPTWDFLANAAIPVIDKRRKVAISPSVLGDTIEVTSPYFFSTFPPVAFKQKVIEKFLGKRQNQRVGIIVINNPWGRAHLETYKKAILATNNVLVRTIVLPKFDNNEISTELAILKNLNLDAILVSLNYSDSVSFLKKIKELDIRAKILGNELFGDIVKNGLLDMSTADGVYFTEISLPQEDFIKKFKENYKKEPGLNSDTAYDAVHLIAKVIEQYGKDSESIKQGLKKIKYNGASGEISFDENNFPSNKKFELILIKNGQFVPYEE
jgi:branched-chain amino acid transport system substrate-binding protein